MIRGVLFVLCLTIAGGCSNLRLKRHFTLDGADWPTEGASVLRKHEAMSRIDPPLIEMWRYDGGAGFGPGGALIADSVVFVGTRKGMVHALNLADGNRLRRKNMGAPIEASMALGKDLLFVPLGLENKSIIALNLWSGGKEWVMKGDPIEAGLLSVDSSLYAVDVNAQVFAIRARDGSVIWKRQLTEGGAVVASPLLAGSTLVVCQENGEIFGLDRMTGNELWRQDMGFPIYNSPAADGETIFVPSTRGVMLALEVKTGRILWEYAVPDETMWFSTPALSSDMGLLVAGGTDNLVRAIDAKKGELVWEADVDAATNTAPLVTQNTVYVGTLQGKLFALDNTTGVVIWSSELTGRIKSALAVYDDKLIVLAETQKVFMFAPDTSSVAVAR